MWYKFTDVAVNFLNWKSTQVSSEKQVTSHLNTWFHILEGGDIPNGVLWYINLYTLLFSRQWASHCVFCLSFYDTVSSAERMTSKSETIDGWGIGKGLEVRGSDVIEVSASGAAEREDKPVRIMNVPAGIRMWCFYGFTATPACLFTLQGPI